MKQRVETVAGCCWLSNGMKCGAEFGKIACGIGRPDRVARFNANQATHSVRSRLALTHICILITLPSSCSSWYREIDHLRNQG